MVAQQGTYEWAIVRIGDCGTWKKGSAISRAEANSGSIPAIRYGEIYTQHDNIIRCFYSFISDDVAAKATKLDQGDIIFACSGETKEDIGKSVVFIDECEAYVGGDTIVFSPIKRTCVPAYLGYSLNSVKVRSQISQTAQGDTVVHTNQKHLSVVEMPLPPYEEQVRIAKALSDIDELIENLEKLIEKKKNIKTGAMQELLTGKRRLPGFDGEWEARSLGECASFRSETASVDTIDSKRYIGTDNMLPNCGGIRENTVELNCKIARKYESGDVLLSNIRPYLKKCHLVDDDGICSVDVLAIRANQRIVVSEYLFAMISSDAFIDCVSSKTIGTKMPRGDKREMIRYEFRVPPLAEQRAIAEVLSDMDIEISQLQKKLDKYKRLKAGMMDELLTGRIRLVD